MAIVILPALMLGGLELALRLGGYGYSTGIFKRAEIGGQQFLVNNDTFGYRFFPREMARSTAPLRMTAKKAPGTFRIFILGESAAMGDPEPAFGASRYLEVLLSERFPGTRFEVVNLGITAINSHVILPIARDAAQQNGDLWIIYMGNNEMVGPFGAATVFGEKAPPLGFVRLNLATQMTRVGQLLVATGRKLKGGGTNGTAWGGMEMFVGNRVPPGDPRRATVHQNFERNLHDIVRTGLNSGATVLLNTVVVNLADCPPFASDTNTSSSAEAEFRRGQFQKACDDDALPFRADSTVNAAIRDAGEKFAGDKLLFLDAAATLASQVPAGVCGDETLYEHVHFNFDGSYRLARAWADEIKRALPSIVAKSIGSSTWLTQPECEELLGLTDWNRTLIYQHMIGRMQQAPLSSQPNNPQRMAALQERINKLEPRKTPEAAAKARENFLTLLARTPDDFVLRENFALFLQSIGDMPQAIAEWQRVREMLPHDYLPHFQIGRLLGSQSQWAGAEASLRQAVAMHPGLTDGWVELGNVLASQEKFQDALAVFAKARQQRPRDAQTIFRMGKVLTKLNRRAEAVQNYREAIQANAANWEYHFELGGELDAANQLDEALREFAEAARLNPSNARAHFNHGVLLAKLGRLDEAQAEFEETLRLDPHYAPARDSLGKVQRLKAQR